MKKINVVVKKAFTDRYTGIKHNEGDKLTITENRYLEIRRSGNYVAVDKAVTKSEKATAEIKK